MKTTEISLAAARAHWARKQGLAERAGGAVSDVVGKTGWLRTLGGIDVYLAARARVRDTSRLRIDEEVVSRRLRVSMALRSCIYLVPRAQAAIALRVSDGLWRKRTERDLERAGTSWREVEDVGRVALSALRAQGARSTDALRRTLPAGAARSLGDAGTKVGLASPLGPALRDLELRGLIERTLPNGRLDSDAYLWRSAEKNVLEERGAPATADAALAALIDLGIGWLGPVTERELAEWIGVARRDLLPALTALGPMRVTIEDRPGEHLVHAREKRALLAAEPVPADAVAFLAFEDSFLVTHGGPGAVADAAHAGIHITPWGPGGESVALGDAKHLATRTIVAGGKLVGTWEIDLTRSEIVVALFAPLVGPARDALEAERAATLRFVHDQLGHARSFSLDTDEAVLARAEALRVVAARPSAKPAAKAPAKSATRAPTAKNAAAKSASAPKAPARSSTRGTTAKNAATKSASAPKAPTRSSTRGTTAKNAAAKPASSTSASPRKPRRAVAAGPKKSRAVAAKNPHRAAKSIRRR